MEQGSRYGMTVARVLVATIFLLNAAGVVDQSVAARELAEHGAPPNLVPFLMGVGRSVELIGGLALVLGIFPRIAALGLMGFLVPATLTAHAFWAADGPQAFMGQLVNFLKNIAMMGGLFLARLGGRVEGWRISLIVLGLFVLFSVIR